MKNLQLLFLASLFLALSNLQAQELEVWISDAGGFSNPPWFVYKTDGNGDNLEEVMNQTDNIEWPEDILFLEEENAVLISNLSSTNGNISKHDIETGDFIEVFADVAGGPTRMQIGPDGYLYVLQWSNSNNKVLRYELDGTFIDEFTTAGVSQSIGMDWDTDGNLYVSSYGGSFIQKFDTNGNDLGPFIDTGLAGPTNIFFDKSGSGDLIVFNWNNGAIKRFDADGNFVEDLITGVGQCEGFAFMPNGDILIGAGAAGAIKRYDCDFNFIEDFVEAGILLTPNAIAIREVPLSVPDHNLEQNFIEPTMGTRFSVKTSSSVLIKSVHIYNISGRLLETLEIEKNTVWNAEKYGEGVYLLKATSFNGYSTTQKVIVKK